MAKIRINRRKDYKEQLKLYLNLSKSLNAKVKKLFKKTARQAEKEYLKYNDMYYFFLEDFSDDFYKILSSHYRAVITASGERLIKQREKKAESEIDIAIGKYINDVTATKVSEVSETTKKSIQRSIKKGIADGESISTISKDIRQNNAFKPYRATMIARTETHSAMNYGNDEISKTLGFKDPVKEWNSALDDRTRAWHRSMNGTVVKQDEMFKVMTPTAGGAFVEKRMMYTGDYQNGGGANVINCRCFTLRYDSEDEVIGATPDKTNIVGDDFIDKPEVELTGFGDQSFEELQFNQLSFTESDKKFERVARLFPALSKVKYDKDKGAYANNLVPLGKTPEINMPVDPFTATLPDNWQSVWRHEYGHTVDYQTAKLFREKSKNSSIKERIKDKRIDVLDDNVEDQISDYYYKEVIEDRKNFKKKFIGEDNYYKTKFSKDYDVIKKKYNIVQEFDIDESILTKNYIDDMLQNGKLLSKSDIDEVLGKDFSINITKIIDKKVELGYDRQTTVNDFVTKLFKFRVNNKNGVFGKQNFGAFEDLTDLSRYAERTKYSQESLNQFSDFVGAGTNNFAGAGHTDEYFAKFPKIKKSEIRTGNTAEMFAQYYALQSNKNNKFFIKKMEELFPNTKNGFDEILNELNKL